MTPHIDATKSDTPLGAVLAGGRGERLGGGKALVELGGRALIEYPLAALAGAGLETFVCVKPGEENRRLRDSLAGSGATAGSHDDGVRSPERPARPQAGAPEGPGRLQSGAPEEPGRLQSGAPEEPGRLQSGAPEEPGRLQSGAPEEPERLRAGVRFLEEPARPRHPLCGVVAALRAGEGRPIVALACDLPFVPAGLVRLLAEAPEPLVVAAPAGRPQPLPARYDPSLLPRLEAALEREEPLVRTVESLAPRLLGSADLEPFGDPARILLNVNDPDDLRRAESLL